MPRKGLEKGDGVPPSPCGLWRDKLVQRERTFPQNGFSLFPKLSDQPLSGTEPQKKKNLLLKPNLIFVNYIFYVTLKKVVKDGCNLP